MSQLEQTSTQYRSLSLSAIGRDLVAMVSQAQDTDLSHLSFAQLLAEHEIAERTRTRINRHHRQAGFPLEKHLEDFDYRHQTTITKRQVNALLDFGIIDNRENIVFIGPPGVGKNHLAIGIGQKAIQAGYKVLFRSALDLVEDLELAEMKGELKKRINQLSKFDVLIVDELGYLPMTSQGRFNLFQLVNALYEYRSIILPTHKDFTDWGEFFHHDNVAIPIIDRVIHHSNIYMLGGESYRLRQKTACQ